MDSPNKSGATTPPDLYGVLNVPKTARNEEIQKAYKTLSKAFHPDRLVRARPHSSLEQRELAQETFVLIKTAHDILNDVVYRFVYDQEGHDGVQLLRQCQQQREGQRALQRQQQHKKDNLQFPLDIDLYPKLQIILRNNNNNKISEMHLSMARQMLRQALQRYQRQKQQLQQRIHDSSALQFDATLEFPCAYHPYGGAVANEKNDRWYVPPYLELEEGRLDFTVRTSNRRTQNATATATADDTEQQQQQQQQQQSSPQKHLYTTSFGTSTGWEANGKATAELSLGVDYQESITSKTQWSLELSAPLQKLPEQKQQQQQQQQQTPNTKRPVKLSASTTHEFASGTVANVGIRGSNVSRESWEYFVTSFRRLSMASIHQSHTNDSALQQQLQPNLLRASCAMGMRIKSQKPLYAFVALNSIPKQEPQQQTTNNKHKKPSILSTIIHMSHPEVQVRAGYHPSPLHASIKYEEFMWPWMSVFASWSWSMAHECSKIKLLLSTDLWGFWNDNESTTFKTGIRHDVVSGWIWLWEWEELDWNLKIPISLSASKNDPWLTPVLSGAGVMVISLADTLHYSIAMALASYVSMQVARSILSDFQSSAGASYNSNEKEQYAHSTKTSDATRSDPDREHHEQEEEEEEEGNESRRQGNNNAFESFMVPVAQKKRHREEQNQGLVLRFAKVMNTQKTLDAWKDGDLESFRLLSPALVEQDITEILQFWVQDGTLNLPPLSSQPAPHYYAFGCPSERSNTTKSWWSLHQLSKEWKRKVNEWIDAVHHATSQRGQSMFRASNPLTKYTLVIRYEFEGRVYEVSIDGTKRIVLPHPDALYMGEAGRVS